MNNKVKNILIVTHQFVPHQSPRTTRWKLIYDELVKKGFNIRVITGTRQDGSDSNIQYIGNKTASGVVSSLRKQSNTDQGSFYKNLALKFLKKIYRFFYKFFAWPDYTMFWVFSIWKNRKKIDFDYDAIISVSLPFSSHVAAYIINKEKRKKWIMDIGDPFSLKSNAFENNKYFYKSLNYYFENKFFKMADQIFFTHKEASLEHKEFFNISNEKIEIGNPISAFSKNVFQNSKTYNYNAEPIKIGYFGILTKGVRSPDEVLKYFQNLDLISYPYLTFSMYRDPSTQCTRPPAPTLLNKHAYQQLVSPLLAPTSNMSPHGNTPSRTSASSSELNSRSCLPSTHEVASFRSAAPPLARTTSSASAATALVVASFGCVVVAGVGAPIDGK